jgi:hypothetical protein
MSFAPATVINQGRGSVAHTSLEELTERCEVATTTLDAFVAEKGITRLDFMKIDIQGGEAMLLDGARRVLTELGPDIIMELSEEDLAAAGRTPADVLGQLETFGYSVYALNLNGTRSVRRRPNDRGHPVHADVFATKRA